MSRLMLRPVSPLLLCGLLVAGACAHAGLLVDADPDWQESEAELPAAIDRASLRTFSVPSRPGTEYFVAENTLSVGEDRVVRYVMLVRGAGGAENLTFEGIRCATGESRIYASGRADGSWVPMKNSAWQPIGAEGFNRPRAALAYNYLCDGPAPPRDRAQALRMLKQPHRDPLNPLGVQ